MDRSGVPGGPGDPVDPGHGSGAPVLTPWFVGVLLYGLALASAALALVGREDRRVTAGLLVLAGASVLLFAVRASGQRGILVVPVGLVTLWAAALSAHGGRPSWVSAAVDRVGTLGK